MDENVKCQKNRETANLKVHALFELSLAAFSASFLLIVLAEMGDKTQFVAMAFAAKGAAFKVLAAVFIASVGNFALVIVVGQFLTEVVPIAAISLAASISFIAFGVWSLREEKPKKPRANATRYGFLATVALTFFIAEFGDKTQLAALSLAVQYRSPVSVLIGATLGMLVADGVGIVVGVVFCRRIPEKIFRWLSAVIFVVFGLAGAYEVLIASVGVAYTALTLLLLIALTAAAIIILLKKQKIHEAANQEPTQTKQPKIG